MYSRLAVLGHQRAHSPERLALEGADALVLLNGEIERWRLARACTTASLSSPPTLISYLIRPLAGYKQHRIGHLQVCKLPPTAANTMASTCSCCSWKAKQIEAHRSSQHWHPDYPATPASLSTAGVCTAQAQRTAPT